MLHYIDVYIYEKAAKPYALIYPLKPLINTKSISIWIVTS